MKIRRPDTRRPVLSRGQVMSATNSERGTLGVSRLATWLGSRDAGNLNSHEHEIARYCLDVLTPTWDEITGDLP